LSTAKRERVEQAPKVEAAGEGDSEKNKAAPAAEEIENVFFNFLFFATKISQQQRTSS